MLKLALLLALQMNSTRAAPHYSLAQLSQAMDVPPRLQLPALKIKQVPSPSTPEKIAPLYTVKAWEKELTAEQACQCLTLVISPDGNVLGTSRACNCGE